jgi:hypothetical protein
LILNVLCKRCHLRLADRKAAVASLPSEAPNSLALQPAGGMALERFNQLNLVCASRLSIAVLLGNPYSLFGVPSW